MFFYVGFRYRSNCFFQVVKKLMLDFGWLLLLLNLITKHQSGVTKAHINNFRVIIIDYRCRSLINSHPDMQVHVHLASLVSGIRREYKYIKDFAQ